MAEVDVMDIRQANATAVAGEGLVPGGGKARKPRMTDGGAEALPDMGHYVTLVRKIRHRPLVAEWLRHLHPVELLGIEWDHKVCASYKQTLFAAVANLPGAIRRRLEDAAQRILLLSDDYGCEAVKSLLRDNDDAEQQAVDAASDKHGRALYFYLRRLFDPADRRFEQAEAARQQNKQWKSEAYASHFRGPKALDITLDDTLKDKLTTAISGIYPQAPLEDVVIEHFQRRNLTQADDSAGDDDAAMVWLHTIVVGFNGKETHWDKIVDGEVTTRHDQALQRITFSYEPSTGALSVFCDDKNARRDLAKALRDVVLASDSQIADMPLREFSLAAFGTAQVFDVLKTEPGDGIERISINLIKVTKPFEQEGEDSTHQLSSGLTIHRDRRDRRDVYAVAREDYKQSDLSQFELAQVKLVLRIANQKDRRAHNITVQITAPNGLNDNGKTEDERQLVMRLLKRWNIVTEF